MKIVLMKCKRLLMLVLSGIRKSSWIKHAVGFGITLLMII